MENITQTWEDPSEQIWTSVDSSTITKTQIDVGDFEDSYDQYNYIPVQTQDVAVLVSCESGAEKSDLERKCQIKKYLWRPKHLIDFIHNAGSNIFVLESSEDYLGFSGEAVATMFKWSDIWGQIEHHELKQRGIYSPKYERNVLFSKTVTLKTSELPRWKPTAIIGKRNFEVDDGQ
jgi:hypothetical protein